MTAAKDIVCLPLAEVGRRLRSGALTCQSLTEACLAREAESRNLNAWSHLMAGTARRSAEALQTLLECGHDLGPLHGIPMGLKANIALAGQPMTAASRILRDNMATTDAVMTRRLKQAGAVFLGLTNMHEFAWGGTTANPHTGTCANAWDAGRIPAGSSGGSGTAVAVGSAMATLGTDTGGSVRLPASMNGVTGLRPTIGRLSVEGIFPLAASMDTVGPLARGAEDCALMFNAMCREDQRLEGARLKARLNRPLAGRRIGLIRGYTDENVQPDIAAAFRAAVAAFERAGAAIVLLDIAGLEVSVDAQVIVDAAEPSTVHDAWIDSRYPEYGNDVRAQLIAGRAFTATEYLHAQRYRTWLRHQFDAVLDGIDAILTPTLPFTAPRMGEDAVMIGDRMESTLTGNMRYTALPSLTALPALSFPIGFDRDGLPIGGQLIAAAREEITLLNLAHLFQRDTDFHSRLP